MLSSTSFHLACIEETPFCLSRNCNIHSSLSPFQKGMLLLLVSALACLGGVARASEPPVSPWQVLNPPLRGEGDAYDIGPLENTYPEEQETDANVATYEDEEEEYIPELPFKLPFKMDKKQVAVAMKLLKEAVKPILKSKSLRETLAYFDEALASFSSDIETQLYLRLILDSAQDLYEGKESAQIHMIMKDFFTDMSDEVSVENIMRKHRVQRLTKKLGGH